MLDKEQLWSLVQETMRAFGPFYRDAMRASVDLRGAGHATVWAVEDLDVAISGLGSVEYYGTPTVKKSVSGLGSVASLGNP